MNYLVPLKKREQIAEGTMAFWFSTEGGSVPAGRHGVSGGDFNFIAGQAVDITLINPPHTDAEGDTRTFSIATSPNHRELLVIATRMRDTAFKNSLKEMPLGTNVRMTEATGDFTLQKNTKKPAVMLAGGIGITPFKSMVEWATEEKLPHKITLLYGNSSRESAPFLDELAELAVQNKNLTYIPLFARIRKQEIKKYVADIAGSIYYLAGPMGFVKAMRELLVKVGADEDSIRTEEFAGY